jgi:acetolactate synthase-1/3 small subunit
MVLTPDEGQGELYQQQLGANLRAGAAIAFAHGLSIHFKLIEALRLADVYRARVVDATISSFVFEVTGGTEKIDKFVELMSEVGLLEVARTGIVAISRGKEAA